MNFFFQRNYLIYLIGFLILITTYSSLYLPLHALMDDYAALSDVYTNSFEVKNLAIAQGRVFSGLFITFWFHLFHSVDSLWCIRLIGIFGMGVIFILMMRLLVTHKFQHLEAFVISLGTCLLPPFIEMANWAVTVTHSWSGVIAMLGVIKLDNIIDKSKNDTLTFQKLYLIIRSRYFLMTIIYLVLAMFTYTPTAQLIFLVPLLWLLGDDDKVVLNNKLYYAFLTFICFFIASLLFLVIYKSYFNIFFSGINLGNRSLITSPYTFIFKIKWFFFDVIPVVSNLFFLAPKVFLSEIVIVICVGQFFIVPESWQRRCIMVLTWIILIMASYSLSLVTQENFPSYRTQFALAIMFWISCWFGLRRFGQLFLSRIGIKISSKYFQPILFSSIVLVLCLRQFFFLGRKFLLPINMSGTLCGI